MRDRYAKNFAEALFTQRREAIDALRPASREGLCRQRRMVGATVSAEGWVKVICEGPTDAESSAKLMALEVERQLAHVPVDKIGQGSKVVLEMKLTEKGPRASGISV